MMLTLAAMGLLMALPAMGDRTLLGALRDLCVPLACRARAACVLCRDDCCAARGGAWCVDVPLVRIVAVAAFPLWTMLTAVLRACSNDRAERRSPRCDCDPAHCCSAHAEQGRQASHIPDVFDDLAVGRRRSSPSQRPSVTFGLRDWVVCLSSTLVATATLRPPHAAVPPHINTAPCSAHVRPVRRRGRQLQGRRLQGCRLARFRLPVLCRVHPDQPVPLVRPLAPLPQCAGWQTSNEKISSTSRSSHIAF